MVLTKPSTRWFHPSLLVLTLAGVVLVIYTTRMGPGLTDDSYYYIQPGQALSAGEPFRLSALFPPLLTVLLAGIHLFGLDILQASRLINALAFGLTILLSGLIILRLSGSRIFALLGASLILLAESLVNIFSWAMSEPLYIVFSLLALLSLDRFLVGDRRGHFWTALALTALAGLTRYIGVALIGTGALAILLWSRQGWGARIRDGLVFGLLSLAPLLAYVLANHFSTGQGFGPRGFATAPYNPDYTRGALSTFLIWFIPGRFVHGREYLAAGSLALLCAVAAVWYRFNRRSQAATDPVGEPGSALGKILALFIGLNLAILFLLLFTRGIIGPGESYSNRYLAPVLVSLLILLAVGAARIWQAGRRPERILVTGLVLMLIAISVFRTSETARFLATTGAGYSSARWHISETIRYLNLHPQVPVVSTGSFGVYFWTGRLPRALNEFSSREEIHAYLRESGGYLVLIDHMPPELYGFSSAPLVEGLTLHQRFSEGTVYTAQP